jgi:UDP-N-acetylglucosamine 2-epimerase (non-hydrolysing)
VKVVSVVGARPQFVKLAPVAAAFDRTAHEHLIIHTGQHYDPRMSDVFFADLSIPAPDVHLGIGSGTHGVQTGAMLAALDPVFEEVSADWVLVYGDTNSTVAAALAAVKQHRRVAHLEAGLRSFNRAMPEEHNRVLTDHAADLLLAPTELAMGHLAREGLADRSLLVGDVMTDVCLRVRTSVADLPLPAELPAAVTESSAGFVVATIHRAENTDDPGRLAAVLDALAGLDVPVALLAHPRLQARCQAYDLPLRRGALHPVTPLAYPDMVRALLGARGVVTDSGGLQKEAYLLGTPCTTLRTETEWVETLAGGWNVLDPELTRVKELADRDAPATDRGAPYGDGDAAQRVVDALVGA